MDEDRGPALAGPLLHQRAAHRAPRPGGRIDELGDPGRRDDNAVEAVPAGDDATPPDSYEEDEAG